MPNQAVPFKVGFLTRAIATLVLIALWVVLGLVLLAIILTGLAVYLFVALASWAYSVHTRRPERA